MGFFKIVALSIGAAILYGICHDQVTVRVCVEYFTIGHAPVFATTSPTLLAFGWGVRATWWMGLFLGLPLVVFARVGGLPKVTAGELVRPIGKLLGAMAVVSAAMGVVGYYVASAGGVHLVGRMREAVPVERHVVFLADLWAHDAAYATGFVGGVVLWGIAMRTRRAKQLASGRREPADGVLRRVSRFWE